MSASHTTFPTSMSTASATATATAAVAKALPLAPHDQRPLVRTAAAVSVFAVVLLAQVGLVLAPSQLAHHPLLVLALRPTPAFLLLVSDLVAPITAVVIAAVSRTLVDMAYFAVARYGALPAVERFGFGKNLAHKVSRRTATRGLLTMSFFWSSTPVVAAIGLGKTPILKFLTITGVGNLATSSAVVYSSYQLSDYIAPITSWVSAHGGQLTTALGSTVALSVILTLRRTRHSMQ
jgi:membrane protein DedA with SNARE-associated domain